MQRIVTLVLFAAMLVALPLGNANAQSAPQYDIAANLLPVQNGSAADPGFRA